MKITTVGELRKQIDGLPDDMPLDVAIGPDLDNALVDACVYYRDLAVFVGRPIDPPGLQVVTILVDGQLDGSDDEGSDE